MIDLHVHSNCSDGTFSPRELVLYALNHDISAFALTDHDTTAGLDEAISCARELSGRVCEENPSGHSLEVVPGIEFSTEYEGKDIHIVGLFIDYHSQVFKDHITSFVESRDTRNEKICALLREQGIPITMEALSARFGDSVITRAHYARYLLENGHVQSLNEAFDRYVGDHASCFVPREKVTPIQAVSLIRAAGGVAVLAHPVLYRMSKARLETLVELLADNGLHAMECFYSTYTPAETREMQGIASRFHLLPSGGSDFHGENKPGLSFGTGYGKLYIHEDVLERLRQLL